MTAQACLSGKVWLQFWQAMPFLQILTSIICDLQIGCLQIKNVQEADSVATLSLYFNLISPKRLKTSSGSKCTRTVPCCYDGAIVYDNFLRMMLHLTRIRLSNGVIAKKPFFFKLFRLSVDERVYRLNSVAKTEWLLSASYQRHDCLDLWNSRGCRASSFGWFVWPTIGICHLSPVPNPIPFRHPCMTIFMFCSAFSLQH